VKVKLFRAKVSTPCPDYVVPKDVVQKAVLLKNRAAGDVAWSSFIEQTNNSKALSNSSAAGQRRSGTLFKLQPWSGPDSNV